MKFTIEREALIKMIEDVPVKLPAQRRREVYLKLWACAARVFVLDVKKLKTRKKPDFWAVQEALVLEDGECFVQGKVLLRILKAYTERKNCTIEVDENGLRLGTFSLTVIGYSPTTSPPAEFHVFPVTDLGVVGSRAQAF